MLRNFSSVDETQALIDAAARQGFGSATTGFGRPEGEKKRSSSLRSGGVAWCKDECRRSSRLVRRVLGRVAHVTGVGEAFHETAQFVRYDRGQRYGVHHDTNPRGKPKLPFGHRILTAFLYLNALAPGGGGETAFDRLGVRVAPERGTLVVWTNAWAGEGGDETATPDLLMFHEARRVAPGCTRYGSAGCTKYGANLWIREFPRSAARR